MIEVLAAIGIFAIVMLMLSTMMAAGMRGVLLGKQRETAVQEMNRLLETARSLSYDNVGLAADDPTIPSDAEIVDVDSDLSYLVEDPDRYEPIEWATKTADHPFNPHIRTFDRGASTLTSHVYVTGVDAVGNGMVDYRRVTVRVSWDPRGTAGSENEVRASTYISESGADPVNPALTADANSFAGSASLQAVVGDLDPLTHVSAGNVDPIVLKLPETTGQSQAPVPSTVTCASRMLSIETEQGTDPTLGGRSVSVTADDDPSGAPTDPGDHYDDGSVTIGALGQGVFATPSTLSSPIFCSATAEAADGLPHEEGWGEGPSSIALGQNLGQALGLDKFGTVTLLEHTQSRVEQSIDHDIVSDTRQLEGHASGSIGSTRVLDLWYVAPRGLVNVESFAYDVQARTSAVEPTGPSASVSGGITVEVFDPSARIDDALCDERDADGYCRATLSPGSFGFDGWSASFAVQEKSVDLVDLLGLSLTDILDLGLTSDLLEDAWIRWDVSVDALPPSVEDGVVGPNGEKRWKASYTAVSVSSRLSIRLEDNTRVADAFVDVVLGQGTARGCRGAACLS